MRRKGNFLDNLKQFQYIKLTISFAFAVSTHFICGAREYFYDTKVDKNIFNKPRVTSIKFY